MPKLLTTSAALEETSVVANNTMNRERGLTGVNSYARELGFDPLDELRKAAAPAWLDLCSGEGRAMREAASWLTPGGLFVAHFDPESVRWADGGSAARTTLRALRGAGFTYAAHRLTLRGVQGVELPFRYAGADPEAGANYTGQPAVGSYYGY